MAIVVKQHVKGINHFQIHFLVRISKLFVDIAAFSSAFFFHTFFIKYLNIRSIKLPVYN